MLIDGVGRYTCRYPRAPLDGDRQVDLYVPPVALEGAPVVLYLGNPGQRRSSEAVLRRWARDGVVGAAVEYGPPPRRIDRIEDLTIATEAAAALVWLRERAGALGGDPAHVVVVGHAIGGTLAALVTARPDWLRAAHDAAGRRPPERAADVVAGVVDLSGPPDLLAPGLGVVDDLLEPHFTPGGRAVASPLTHLLAGPDSGSPPVLMISGGKWQNHHNNLWGDPDGTVTGMRRYVLEARSRGVRAAYVQPVFAATHEIVHRGQWCFAHLAHDNTRGLLAGPDTTVRVLGLQTYYAGSLRGNAPNICDDLALAQVRVRQRQYLQLVDAFIRAPDGPIAWETPAFTHNSVPPVSPSPLRVNVGGGVLPDADGGGWSADHRGVQLDASARVTHDVPAAPDGGPVEGLGLPAGLFHFQRAAPFELGLRVPPGRYRLEVFTGLAPADAALTVRVGEGGDERGSLAVAAGRRVQIHDAGEVTVEADGDADGNGPLSLHFLPDDDAPALVAAVALRPL